MHLKWILKTPDILARITALFFINQIMSILNISDLEESKFNVLRKYISVVSYFVKSLPIDDIIKLIF